MKFLRQSTTVTVQMGPALDKTDGVTPETTLSPTVYVSKNGAAQAARNSATAIAHDRDGYYRVELNATDTNTLGRLRAQYTDEATHTPVWEDYMVLPAMIYDAFVAGTDRLDTNVTHIGDTAQTANDNGADINTILSRIIGTLAAGTHNPQSGDVFGALPTNFSSMVISAGGAVDSLLQGFLNTLITEATAGRIAANFDTFFENGDAAATAILDNLTTLIAGVTLAASQGAITFTGPLAINATGSDANIDLSGSGSGDGLVFSRSGAGGLFGTNWDSALSALVLAALTADTTKFNGADIATILGRLPTALVSGRMNSNVSAINDSNAAAIRLALSTGTIVPGTAQTGTLSSTQMTTDLTEGTDNHYIGRSILWTSGVLQDQYTEITDYATASGLLTFNATETGEAPSNGDTFIII